MSENQRATDQQMLASYLAQWEDYCPSCHYNIHKLTSDTCPECGEKLRLQVALKMPKMGAFIAGLIGLSASAGFPILFLGIFFLAIVGNGYQPGHPYKLTMLYTLFFLINAVFVFLWCRFKLSLIRSKTRFRWPLALTAWLLCPMTVVISFIVMQLYQ
ncbi:hypothetical protein [Poriferisphaera sp. WC338]|uniref:hypothetical protein n=1 Tax=Poriferisphaera sp. WC338 TaxID=3425129 RepID=UPI003D819379